MAQNDRGRSSNQDRNFEDMSNADLIAFIGGDIDPNTNRADLIVMAIEADDNRRGER